MRENADRTARTLPRDQEGISLAARYRRMTAYPDLLPLPGREEASDTCDVQSDVSRRSCVYCLAPLSVPVNDTSLDRHDGIVILFALLMGRRQSTDLTETFIPQLHRHEGVARSREERLTVVSSTGMTCHGNKIEVSRRWVT